MNRETAHDIGVIADWSPEEAWSELEKNSRSCLVDVRTKPEWAFVGVPDLSSIGRRMVFAEWNAYPSMSQNKTFYYDVAASFVEDWPNTMFFICRSGARSKAAATEFSNSAIKVGKPVRCLNVAEGFEGDLDSEFRRSQVNGWKFKQLPWRQT